MNEDSPYSSYNLDHLGLIAGMVDELGLSELIDIVIKQDHEQRQVSVGQCVKAMVLGSNYGGVKQRWLVVYTQAARGRAEQTVNKQHLKQSQAEYKAFNALAKRSFACAADAETALVHLQKTLKVVALHDPCIVEVAGFKGKGRPSKDRKPDIVSYRIEAGVASVLEARHRKIQQKSCFIIASNQLEDAQLSHEELLDYYTPGRYHQSGVLIDCRSVKGKGTLTIS